MVTLNKPNAGAVGWAGAINDNWTALESAVNSAVSYDILDITTSTNTLSSSDRGKLVTNHGYASGYTFTTMYSTTPTAGHMLAFCDTSGKGMLIDTGSASVGFRMADGTNTGRYMFLFRKGARMTCVAVLEGSTYSWQVLDVDGGRPSSGAGAVALIREAPDWFGCDRWNGRWVPVSGSTFGTADGCMAGPTYAVTSGGSHSTGIDGAEGVYLSQTGSAGAARVYSGFPLLPENNPCMWVKFFPSTVLLQDRAGMFLGFSANPSSLTYNTNIANSFGIEIEYVNSPPYNIYIRAVSRNASGTETAVDLTSMVYTSPPTAPYYARIFYENVTTIRVELYDHFYVFVASAAITTNLPTSGTSVYAMSYTNNNNAMRLFYVYAAQAGVLA